MADNAMSLPQSFVSALRYQVHKCVSSALHELQNCCATPPIQHSAAWKTCVQVSQSLCPFLEARQVCSLQEGGNRLLVEWTCSVVLKHHVPSPLPFPPSSARSEDTDLFWLCTASKKDHRRIRVYRSRWLTLHSSIWTEQDEPPLHCSVTESSAEI